LPTPTNLKRLRIGPLAWSCGCLWPLLRLVYIVEEEPLPQATSTGAFVIGQLLELFPGQAEGRREGLKDLQDVRQLSGEVIRRGLLCLMGLFGKLDQQRGTVAVLVQVWTTARYPCDSIIAGIRSRTSLP
jgi:hypothetical protein